MLVMPDKHLAVAQHWTTHNWHIFDQSYAQLKAFTHAKSRHLGHIVN